MRAHTTIVFTTLFSLWSGTYLHLQLYLVRWNPLVLYTFMIFINLARYYHQHNLLRFHRIRIHANIHFCISVQFYLKSHVLPLDDPEIMTIGGGVEPHAIQPCRAIYFPLLPVFLIKLSYCNSTHLT